MATLGNMPNHEIPRRAGIGLRAEHFEDVLEQRPDVGWFEVHSENYFGLGDSGIQGSGSKSSDLKNSDSKSSGLTGRGGGKPLEYLERIRQHYPISLHGVGLSIGSTDPISHDHLGKLRLLVDQIQPGLISEHLSWGSVEDKYFNDLLPMPYTEEALDHMVQRVSQVQEFLGRQILIENVSSYLEYQVSTIPEWEFVSQLAKRAGCGVLLDVNNIYVNAMNHGFDPDVFVNSVPVDVVKEIHLAGHTVKEIDGGVIRLDTHDQLVCEEVWDLYRLAVDRFGNVPALIEWDKNLPDLDVLVNEAKQADLIREDVLAGNHERIA